MFHDGSLPAALADGRRIRCGIERASGIELDRIFGVGS